MILTVDFAKTDNLAFVVNTSRLLQHPTGTSRNQSVQIDGSPIAIDHGMIDEISSVVLDARPPDHHSEAVNCVAFAVDMIEDPEVRHLPAIVEKGVSAEIS